MRTIPKPSASGKTKASEPDLATFHMECGGMFELAIFDMQAAAICAAAAILGDPLAYAYIQAIGDLKEKIQKLRRPVCIACDFVFFPKRPPVAVAVGLGMPFAIGTISTAIVSGICGACLAKGQDFVMARALEHGRTIWPDLRVVDRANIGFEAGRA